MTNPANLTPADRLHQATLQAIGTLTDYRIGYMWAAENDGNPKRLMAKSREWRLKQPKTLSDFAEMISAIGYRIEIHRKE
jgi:hypothetical protein